MEMERERVEVLALFQDVLSWGWDSRLETSLAEFKIGQQEEIRAILDRRLGCVWDCSTIATAPENVRAVVDYFGKLRPGQLFFATDPGRGWFVFCAWWPWGDGKTISLRVAAADEAMCVPEKTGLVARLKRWVGLES